MDFKKYIIDVKDFPKEGVVFKDITPLLNDPVAFKAAIDEMVKFVKSVGATAVVGPEARGFVFAAPVAYAAGIKFVLVRKPGKLPKAVDTVEYKLEYGVNSLQMQQGDLKPDDKVVIIDDILATGGTIEAIIKLVDKQGASISGLCFLADLTKLHDDKLEKTYEVKSLTSY